MQSLAVAPLVEEWLARESEWVAGWEQVVRVNLLRSRQRSVADR
jgi:hypothetical protein